MSAQRPAPAPRISWTEARRVVAALPTALPAQLVPLADCVGRELAAPVSTPIDIPHYASAAMDGWMVAGPGPWGLASDRLTPGHAREVVTGAPVPADADAVLRSESGIVRGGTLESVVAGEPRPGQHIRRAGTEATAGELLLGAGEVLNPAAVALLASAGVDEVAVRAVPEVALVLTGDEVVGRGIPPEGRVRDSFSVPLPALLGGLGANVIATARVGDARADTVRAIARADAPLILTTGGTGGSAADHVRPALRELGADVRVDGIAMRPGGPTAVAVLPDGRIVVALPGNPLAAMVVAITLCEPLIAALAGRSPRPPARVVAAAAQGRAGTTTLSPFDLIEGRAVPTPWTGAGMMRGLARARGILVIPEGGLAAGELAQSVPLPW